MNNTKVKRPEVTKPIPEQVEIGRIYIDHVDGDKPYIGVNFNGKRALICLQSGIAYSSDGFGGADQDFELLESGGSVTIEAGD